MWQEEVRSFSLALHFCLLVPKAERAVAQGPSNHCPTKLPHHDPLPVLFLLAG